MIKVSHVSGTTYNIEGYQYLEDGSPNMGCVAKLFSLDTQTGTTALIARDVTDYTGKYEIEKSLSGGSYVIKFDGIGVKPENQTEEDWELFSIPSTAGDSSQVTLVASTLVVYASQDGTPVEPQGNITLDAVYDNITSPTWTWTVTADAPTITLGGSGGSRTLPVSEFNNRDIIQIKVQEDGTNLYDIVTIGKLTDGSDNFVVVLSNESHTVPASSSGAVDAGDLADAETYVNMYRGITKLPNTGTNSWSISTVDSASVDSSTTNDDPDTSTRSVVLTDFLNASNSGYVDITCTHTASSTVITKRFSVSKSIAGSYSNDAKTIKLSANSLVIYADQYGNAVEPQGGVTLTVTNTNITSPSYSWSLDPSVTYTYPNTPDTDVINIALSEFDNTTPVDLVEVTVDETGNTLSDVVTIGKLTDGSDNIVLVLTNESHTVPASHTGVVTSGDLEDATTDIILYRGLSEVDKGDWSFTPTGYQVSFDEVDDGTEKSITITSFDAGKDYGYVDISVTHPIGGSTYVRRFSVSKSLAGGTGEGLLYRGAWSSGEDYDYIENVRRDIVYASDTNYYYTVQESGPGTISGAVDPTGVGADSHWIQFTGSFSAVATDILLAENATITNVLIMGDSGGNAGIIRSSSATGLYTYDATVNKTGGYWLSPTTSSGNGSEFRVGTVDNSNLVRGVVWDGTSLIVRSDNYELTADGDLWSKSGGFGGTTPVTRKVGIDSGGLYINDQSSNKRVFIEDSGGTWRTPNRVEKQSDGVFESWVGNDLDYWDESDITKLGVGEIEKGASIVTAPAVKFNSTSSYIYQTISGPFAVDNIYTISFYARASDGGGDITVKVYEDTRTTPLMTENLTVGKAWTKQSCSYVASSSDSVIVEFNASTNTTLYNVILGHMEIDNVTISLDDYFVSLSDKGLYVYGSIDKQIKINKDEFSIIGADLEVQDLIIYGDLDVYGTQTIYVSATGLLGTTSTSFTIGSGEDYSGTVIVDETSEDMFLQSTSGDYRFNTSSVSNSIEIYDNTGASFNSSLSASNLTLYASAGVVGVSLNAGTTSTISNELVVGGTSLTAGYELDVNGDLLVRSDLVVTDTTTLNDLVVINANLDVQEYIRHAGDVDTYFRFENDKISYYAGGIQFLKMEEVSQDIIYFNPAGVDIDFQIGSVSGNAVEIDGGSGDVTFSNSVDVGGNLSSTGLTVSNGVTWLYSNTDGTRATHLKLGTIDTGNAEMFSFDTDDTDDSLYIKGYRYTSNVYFTHNTATVEKTSMWLRGGSDGTNYLVIKNQADDGNSIRLHNSDHSYFMGGHLGIGKVAPARILDVEDTAIQFRISYDGTYFWEQNVNSSGTFSLYNKDGEVSFYVLDNHNFVLAQNQGLFFDSNTNIKQENTGSLRITSSATDSGDGNMNILLAGTGLRVSTSDFDVPTYTFEVDGTVGINDYIYHNGDPDTWIRFETNDVAMQAGGFKFLEYDHANTNLRLNATGDIIVNPSANDLYPQTNTVNLGTTTNKWLTLHARELWVSTLVAQDVMATIGGRIIVAPTTYLVAALTDSELDITINTYHDNYEEGDILILQSGGKFEAVKVVSTVTGTPGDYSANVDRNFDNSGFTAWDDGDAVVNTGGSATDEGFIDLYSESGITSGTGPTIVGNVRSDNFAWGNYYPNWAIGNLNGLYGISSTTQGVALGEYTGSGDTYSLFLSNEIKMYANDVQRVSIQSDGSGWIGNSSGNERIAWTSAGVLSVNKITAITGTIGTFNIDSAGMYSGTTINADGISLNASTETFFIGSNSAVYWGWNDQDLGEGILMGLDSGAYKFSIGKAGRFITWDGADLLISFSSGGASATGVEFSSGSTKNITTGFAFYDPDDPKLWVGAANSASMDWNATTPNTLTVRGHITAESGYIGTAANGWEISSSSLSNITTGTGIEFTVGASKTVTRGIAVYNAGDPQLFIGDETTNMQWDTNNGDGSLIMNNANLFIEDTSIVNDSLYWDLDPEGLESIWNNKKDELYSDDFTTNKGWTFTNASTGSTVDTVNEKLILIKNVVGEATAKNTTAFTLENPGGLETVYIDLQITYTTDEDTISGEIRIYESNNSTRIKTAYLAKGKTSEKINLSFYTTTTEIYVEFAVSYSTGVSLTQTLDIEDLNLVKWVPFTEISKKGIYVFTAPGAYLKAGSGIFELKGSTAVVQDLVVTGSWTGPGGTGGSSSPGWVVSGNDMWSLPTGSTGIGTTAPTAEYKLDVNGKIFARTGLRVGSLTTNGMVKTTGSNGTLAVVSAISEQIVITAATASIDLSVPPLGIQYVHLYKNGLALRRIIDYTLSVDVITLTSSRDNFTTDDDVYVEYYY